MPTFSDLGIPFPLFEGPTEDASEYCGLGQCSLCGTEDARCFELGIGADLIVSCAGCRTENPLDADDREDTECRQCGITIHFPQIDEDSLKCCYRCLRNGRAVLSKDSVLGMIGWEQAQSGVTHGIPGLKRTDFEMVPLADGWVGARVAQEHLLELIRMPTYSSIQGDRWQFCCQCPMVYVGSGRELFSTLAPNGDGRALFEQIVQQCVDRLWEDKLHDLTGVYVFRCGSCGRLTAHWDIA
jgi:uncharacterized protein CbrC (UPF0167 family)